MTARCYIQHKHEANPQDCRFQDLGPKYGMPNPAVRPNTNPHLTCVTCKFYRAPGKHELLAKCTEPKAAYPDHVNGGITEMCCSTMRSTYGECKPSADLWEANAATALEIEKDKKALHAMCKGAMLDGNPYRTSDIADLRHDYGATLLHDDQLHDLICDYLPYEQEYTGEEDL